MNKLNFKPRGIPRGYSITLVVGLIIGCISMSMFDAFVSSHTFSYQSPILVQAPVIIKTKLPPSPIVVIKTVEASSEAVQTIPEPTAEPLPIKK